MGKKSKRRGVKRYVFDERSSRNVRNKVPIEILPDPVPADHQPASLRIRVRDEEGEETLFSIHPTTRLKNLSGVYATQKGVAATTFQFLLDGHLVSGHQTPADINMECGDQLDARYSSSPDTAADMLHAASRNIVNISIREQTGEKTFFKVGKAIKLRKIFNAYAARKGVAATTLVYLFKGKLVGGHQTAADLGMEDGDQIDCFPSIDFREIGESHRGNRLPVDEATKRDKSVVEFKLGIFETRESVVIDDADGENFDEYMGLILEDKSTARDRRAILHAMKRWPRIRKYWPRVRRRICSACGKYTLDLSQPRYLVCGGCGKGRGVGRYCSETCQAEHWPVHSTNCAYIPGPTP